MLTTSFRQRIAALLPRSFVYTRNLGTSWLAYGATLIVAFFLSPFIIRSLGNTAYGFWTLLMSMTGYLGLIDLGVRVSTGRYLNYYLGLNDEEGANRVISTSLVMYSLAGVFVLAAAFYVGMQFGSIFSNIPEGLARDARLLLPLLGTGVWLSLYASVFGQILIARERFDVKNLSDVTILVIRSVATVAAIRSGWGLLGLAGVLVGSSAVECVLLYLAVRLLHIPFDVGARHITRATFRELVGFSSWSFLINAGSRIIQYTDAAVIGIFLGVVNVTIYSVGFMLIDYGSNLMAHVVGVMTPEIYKTAGAGDLAALRRLVVDGARNTMFFAVPLLVGFVMFGDAFIRLWLGPGYGASAQVLAILSIAQLGLLASRGCGAALWGLGTLKLLAAITLCEAVANLSLSILLAVTFGLGVLGIALGTAIPMVVIGWGVLPFYACQKIHLPLSRYVRLTAGRWIPASLLLAGVCMAVRSLFTLTTWPQFASAVAVVVAAYLPIGWFFMLRGAEASDRTASLSPA